MAHPGDYYFTGLDKGGWFEANFADYALFGYIGDRKRLENAILQNRSMARKVFQIGLPKLKISSLLKTITGCDLPTATTDSGLAQQLFYLLANEENRRTVYEQLTALQKRARKDDRYFERVSRQDKSRRTVYATPSVTLEDKLITVEGQLVHRSTVPQHSKTFAATLRASTNEWILCDYPPHALNEDNPGFDGNALLLNEDKGFSAAFARYLPFRSQIGWYPYVRVTGFFSAARLNTEKLCSLSISLVEFRPPKKYLEVRGDLLSFSNNELRPPPVRLAEWSDLILFLYLAPLVATGSNLQASDLDAAFASVLRTYATKVGADVPVSLTNFYAGLP